MKQPKKPTLAQKKILHVNELDWKEWNVLEEDEISLTVLRKADREKKVLLK